MPVLKSFGLFIFLIALISDTGAQITTPAAVQSTIPDGSSENITHINSDKLNGHLESQTVGVLPNFFDETVEEISAEADSDSDGLSENSQPSDESQLVNSENEEISNKDSLGSSDNGGTATKDLTDGFKHLTIINDYTTSGDFLGASGEYPSDENETITENYKFVNDVLQNEDASDKDYGDSTAQTTEEDIFNTPDTQNENDKSLFKSDDPSDDDDETTTYNYRSTILKEVEELLTKGDSESSNNSVATNIGKIDGDLTRRSEDVNEVKNNPNRDIPEASKQNILESGDKEIDITSNGDSTTSQRSDILEAVVSSQLDKTTTENNIYVTSTNSEFITNNVLKNKKDTNVLNSNDISTNLKSDEKSKIEEDSSGILEENSEVELNTNYEKSTVQPTTEILKENTFKAITESATDRENEGTSPILDSTLPVMTEKIDNQFKGDFKDRTTQAIISTTEINSFTQNTQTEKDLKEVGFVENTTVSDKDFLDKSYKEIISTIDTDFDANDDVSNSSQTNEDLSNSENDESNSSIDQKDDTTTEIISTMKIKYETQSYENSDTEEDLPEDISNEYTVSEKSNERINTIFYYTDSNENKGSESEGSISPVIYRTENIINQIKDNFMESTTQAIIPTTEINRQNTQNDLKENGFEENTTVSVKYFLNKSNKEIIPTTDTEVDANDGDSNSNETNKDLSNSENDESNSGSDQIDDTTTEIISTTEREDETHSYENNDTEEDSFENQETNRLSIINLLPTSTIRTLQTSEILENDSVTQNTQTDLKEIGFVKKTTLPVKDFINKSNKDVILTTDTEADAYSDVPNSNETNEDFSNSENDEINQKSAETFGESTTQQPLINSLTTESFKQDFSQVFTKGYGTEVNNDHSTIVPDSNENISTINRDLNANNDGSDESGDYGASEGDLYENNESTTVHHEYSTVSSETNGEENILSNFNTEEIDVSSGISDEYEDNSEVNNKQTLQQNEISIKKVYDSNEGGEVDSTESTIRTVTISSTKEIISPIENGSEESMASIGLSSEDSSEVTVTENSSRTFGSTLNFYTKEEVAFTEKIVEKITIKTPLSPRRLSEDNSHQSVYILDEGELRKVTSTTDHTILESIEDNRGKDSSTETTTDSIDEKTRYQIAIKKIYDIKNNITNLINSTLTEIRTSEAVTSIDNDSVNTVINNTSDPSEHYSDSISSSEEEIRGTEEVSTIIISNRRSSFSTTSIYGRFNNYQTTDAYQSPEEDKSGSSSGSDTSEEEPIPYINANVFGNHANVSIKIEIEDSFFYVPSDAYFHEDLDNHNINITWISSHNEPNNSLFLMLSENPKFYSVKGVQLKLDEDYNLDTWNQNVTDVAPDNDTFEEGGFAIHFEDDVRIYFSNLDFLRTEDTKVISQGVDLEQAAIGIDTKEIGIVTGCVTAGLIVCAMIYFIIVKSRKRTQNMEDLTKYNIPV